ncbi:MAG: glycosyltransferase family 4 protein [Candidatus Absconditabacterales bacterium]
MSKINVIKFVPYFPPHKGGLESHVQERSQWWIKKGYGDVINVVTPMGQESIIENGKLKIENYDGIYYKNQLVGYMEAGYQVVILDAFDLIPVFPFPRFWTKRFRTTISYLKSQVKGYGKKHTLVNTHTRFFLTSLVGGVFAKYVGITWIHIEHGVDFVKLASKFKSWIAYIYDQSIGRYIFRCSDMVIGISAGCQRFANKFTQKKIPVIHRGMNFEPMNNEGGIINDESKKKTIIIGFVGRLVKLKGLDLLLQAFDNLQKKHHNLILEIVGDGDQLDELQDIVKDLGLEGKVSFLGFKDRNYVANEFLPHVDIVVNPSYQEGLPTSVLEGLLSKCVVVATSVGGTPEISDQKDLILVDKGNVSDLQKGLEYAIQNHAKLKGLSYEQVKKHFDWKRSIERYYEVYLGMIGHEK